MSRRFHILFAESDGWTLSSGPEPVRTTRVVVDAKAAPSAVAAAVRAALEADGYDGGPVGVCVPSAWCLAATISTADLPRGDIKTMTYRLEEDLPTAAENLIADFVPAATNGSALGVCIRIELIQPVIDALEAAGVAVHSIVPAALATVQGLAGQDRLLLCAEPGPAGPQLNLIALSDGRPARWSLVPAVESDLQLELGLLSIELASNPPMEAVDLPPELIAVIEKITGTGVQPEPVAGREAAANLMAAVLAGRTKPWVNFRRGPLAIDDPLRMHRRWIDLSLVAAITLLLCLTAVFLLRASRYARIEAQSDAEMAADFHRRFPTWQVPPNIPAAVESQYRRSTRAGSADLDKSNRGSAVTTLRDVLVPLSAEQHFQIDRMAFHDNAFVVSGRLQSYDQIDVIAKAVRSHGMAVAPAQTRRAPDGTWTFVLQGSRPAAIAVAARGLVN
jgi:type II secretory pathway component PulL